MIYTKQEVRDLLGAHVALNGFYDDKGLCRVAFGFSAETKGKIAKNIRILTRIDKETTEDQKTIFAGFDPEGKGIAGDSAEAGEFQKAIDGLMAEPVEVKPLEHITQTMMELGKNRSIPNTAIATIDELLNEREPVKSQDDAPGETTIIPAPTSEDHGHLN